MYCATKLSHLKFFPFFSHWVSCVKVLHKLGCNNMLCTALPQ